MRDEFDLRALRRMYRYWDEHPPVHELVAAYMGVGTKKAKAKPANTNLMDLARELGASGFNGIQRKRQRQNAR